MCDFLEINHELTKKKAVVVEKNEDDVSEAMSYFNYKEKKVEEEETIIIMKDELVENREFDEEMPYFRNKHQMVLLED